MPYQAILFSRRHFLLAAQARAWLKQRGLGGGIKEDDPEVWEFTQHPRSTFTGPLVVEPLHGEPGVSVRVLATHKVKAKTAERRAYYRKNPLHPSHIVDYEVRVKPHDSHEYLTIANTSDLGKAIREAKDYAKSHVEPGSVVLWQVRGATNGKIYASHAPKKRKVTKRKATKVTKKRVAKKVTKKRKVTKRKAKKATKKHVAKKVTKKRKVTKRKAKKAIELAKRHLKELQSATGKK